MGITKNFGARSTGWVSLLPDGACGPRADSERIVGAMNMLYYGDNLTVLRNEICDESVDLIYLDPPFNSRATYNVLFRTSAGQRSRAQSEAFEDTWHWEGGEAELAFDEVMSCQNASAIQILRSLRSFLKENDMMAYLCMMAIRLLELHRKLKPTGSIYLHCDPTASHYLKVLMDNVFGVGCFRNELIWKRTYAHGSSNRFGPVHDVILFYSKSEEYVWNKITQQHSESYLQEKYRFTDDRGKYRLVVLTGPGVRKGPSGNPWRGYNPTTAGRHWAIPGRAIQLLRDNDVVIPETLQEQLEVLYQHGFIRFPQKAHGEIGVPECKLYLPHGQPVQDVIVDIPPVNSQADERMGYPTQKPVALLERLIAASSREGDLVLDPFCGCGTTIHAAQKLRREWIGIDITHLAIWLIENRLKDAFPGIQYEVHGTPKDLEGARDLATRDKYEFQCWVLSQIKAVPFGGKKKGSDTGIDGIIPFKPEGKTTETAIVSVKGGGKVSVPMIRELAHVVERENAKIGVFVTLAKPTSPMKTEAIKCGFYETLYGKYPRLQILTVAEMFAGKRPNIPLVDSSAFRRAAKECTDQQELLPLQ